MSLIKNHITGLAVAGKREDGRGFLEYRKPIRRGREIQAPFTFIQRQRKRIMTFGEKKEIS